jgi:hypothetical protein
LIDINYWLTLFPAFFRRKCLSLPAERPEGFYPLLILARDKKRHLRREKGEPIIDVYQLSIKLMNNFSNKNQKDKEQFFIFLMKKTR